MPKWAIIGRNQYRLVLSSVREIRPYFPYLALALLAIYVFYGAPALVDVFVDEALELLLSRAALATTQLLFLLMCLWFFFFPVALALKEVQAGHVEIFLSAPVSPGHILLGEFLGVMPFYAIGVTIIAGIFTAVLAPLGITIFQSAIIVAVFALTLLSMLWFGVLAAALLRTRLGQSERGKDIGKGIGFLMALPVVGIMYAMMGGGLFESLTDQGAKGTVGLLLSLLPSSWGASVIVDFANNPGNITAVWQGTLLSLLSLTLLLALGMWAGTRLANRAYAIQTGSLSSSRVREDGAFYNSIRSLGGGGSFGSLLVAILKDYGRRLQNLSRVAYIVGLVVLVNVFLIKPEAPIPAMMMSQALFAMLAAFVVGEVTIRGKETLFIYRKAPKGQARLIKARLVQGWLVTVPVATLMMAAQLALMSEMNLLTLLGFTGLISVVVAGYVVLCLGAFLAMPAFTDKGGEFMVVATIVAMFAVGIFLAPLILLGESWALFSLVAGSWTSGVALLMIGRWNLGRIE